jgi:hypothetical protein
LIGSVQGAFEAVVPFLTIKVSSLAVNVGNWNAHAASAGIKKIHAASF